MAYKSIVLTPNNITSQVGVQQTQFYRGFSTADSTTLSSKMYDLNLIKQNIINHFQTRRGERVMNPEFGTIIWDVIFDPFTASIKQAISDDVTRILNYDRRAIPTEITIIEAESGMIIDATLYYSQINMSEKMKLDFNKATGLVTVQ
jgi:phage baseplate assembly protein W